MDNNTQQHGYHHPPYVEAAFAHAGHGRVAALKAALEQHPDLISTENENGNHLLARAAKWGHLNCVELLLKQPNIDVNHTNRQGFSALDKAAWHGHWDIVSCLLKVEGINPNGSDRETRHGAPTPLLLAAKAGRPDIMKELANLGAIITYHDNQSRNLLHYAAQAAENQQAVMQLAITLIQKQGRDIVDFINIQAQGSGNTPLHDAAKASNAAGIELLLAHNANQNIQNNFNNLPKELASTEAAKQAFGLCEQIELPFGKVTVVESSQLKAHQSPSPPR